MLRRIKLDKLERKRKEILYPTHSKVHFPKTRFPLAFNPSRGPSLDFSLVTRRQFEVKAAQRNRRLGRSRNRARNGTLGRNLSWSFAFVCRPLEDGEGESKSDGGGCGDAVVGGGTLARIIWRQSHFSHVKYGGFRKIPWRRNGDGIGPRMRLFAASARSLPAPTGLYLSSSVGVQGFVLDILSQDMQEDTATPPFLELECT